MNRDITLRKEVRIQTLQSIFPANSESNFLQHALANGTVSGVGEEHVLLCK